ncbi:hypothetical protein KC332_g2657 [Hortaea werneckii]|uniref:F-box domain-containing protein n=1 Tax=Hortaea werneckii EXF-2000 TaxID=1157616 RepID=A0A1Z5SQD0_HORWE|nr:hypothetical protein KC358_g2503 [Hortaea werneckii]OTA23035.1 hypothetical protein BTJ68_14045 [Hortaea werneckii EXF-2000]KAI6850532.1 hypothetical protein KC350_g2084 [Hortaea werneckii]KAI6942150.1 hypothetical protein KC341_g2428 [Hortaea werneckii]KAI6946939.1 hypothetical protein KC348_g2830 [Hortaea werneckii]
MGSIQQEHTTNLAQNTSSLPIPAHHPTPTTRQTSPLLTLPPELRNKIYSLALTSSSAKPRPTPTGRLQRPALLKTNVQLRAETTQMWFAQTSFQLSLNPSNLSNLQHFLANLGPANLAVLGGLELQYTHCVGGGQAVGGRGEYPHPRTRQAGIRDLLFLLAEAGVRMDALEVSTARCKCREGGRCKSSARAYVIESKMLLGAFRSTSE